MTVAVVPTGGAIASTEDEGGDANPQLSSERTLVDLDCYFSVLVLQKPRVATIVALDAVFPALNRSSRCYYGAVN